jgi:hypothetical protein
MDVVLAITRPIVRNRAIGRPAVLAAVSVASGQAEVTFRLCELYEPCRSSSPSAGASNVPGLPMERASGRYVVAHGG